MNGTTTKTAPRLMGFLVVLILALGATCLSQDLIRNETVHFAPGTSSTTIKSSIKGYAGVKYLVALETKQTMTVSFKPSNGSCYFNVWAPGADSAIFNGSSSGDYSFKAKVTTSGDYGIQVYMMRNAARRNETCRYMLNVAAQ